MLTSLAMIALVFPLSLISLAEKGSPMQAMTQLHPPVISDTPRSTLNSAPPLLAKKKAAEKDTKVVSVIDARVASENVAGTWYYTLNGNIINNAGVPARNVVVYYEISAAGKIVDAGSTLIQPSVLQPGARGQFELSVKMAGQVKITLIEWLKPDRSYASFGQMQVFP